MSSEEQATPLEFAPRFLIQYQAVDLAAVGQDLKPVGKYEHPLGVLTENMIRLWALRTAAYKEWHALRERIRQHDEKHRREDVDPAECKELFLEKVHLEAEKNFLNGLLRHDFSFAFLGLDVACVELRAGFQFVAAPSEESPGSLKGLLDAIRRRHGWVDSR